MNEPSELEGELVDLAALGASLLAGTAEDHAGGRAGRTVVHGPSLRATVIALRAGHELGEHDAPATATLFVHTGQVRLRGDGHEQAVGAGQLTTIPHERHSLFADTDTVLLLTVRLD